MGTPVDRTGAGRIVEVYPAATMKACGLDAAGYKQESASRQRLLEGIARQTAGWLRFGEIEAACAASDHVFDGLISAITAVFALKGLTDLPDTDQLDAARREGWIHAPSENVTLASLSQG